MGNRKISSYQRLKESYAKMNEQYQKDIKVLLEGRDSASIEKIQEKYKFLKNQKEKTLFGPKASIAAQAINRLLQNL
jgi:hypothetical protein